MSQVERSTAAAPPKLANTRLSVSNWRIIRPRLAPSAVRMTKSRCRALVRTSNKLATLAQAISNTKPTAPNKTNKAGRTGPTSWSRNGITATPMSRFVTGYCAPRRAAIDCISSFACATVRPGFRRPMRRMYAAPRICESRGVPARGAHKSRPDGY
jgi:hypothetical protein